MGGERLLAVIALDEAFQLLLGGVFLEIGEDHLHLLLLLVLSILTGEGGVAAALHILHYHRLRPYLHVLVSRVVDLDVQVVRTAAHTALLIKGRQLLQDETSERSIFLGVEYFVFVLDGVAYFCEVGPLVLEGVGFGGIVVLETALVHLWII